MTISSLSRNIPQDDIKRVLSIHEYETTERFENTSTSESAVSIVFEEDYLNIKSIKNKLKIQTIQLSDWLNAGINKSLTLQNLKS